MTRANRGIALLRRNEPALRRWARVILGVSFIAVGVTHFTHPAFFEAIVPPPLPARWCVWVSGAAEIAGGVGVFIPRLRRAAGWGLMALLLAVYPANIYSAIAGVAPAGLEVEPWELWARLPYQFVLWAWVWWTTLARPSAAHGVPDATPTHPA